MNSFDKSFKYLTDNKKVFNMNDLDENTLADIKNIAKNTMSMFQFVNYQQVPNLYLALNETEEKKDLNTISYLIGDTEYNFIKCTYDENLKLYEKGKFYAYSVVPGFIIVHNPYADTEELSVRSFLEMHSAFPEVFTV